MTIVNDILREKGNTYYWVKPDTITIDALQLMADKNVGALLVIENEKLFGVFSERDYARKIVLKGKSSINTHVSEFMTSTVYAVRSSDPLSACMQLMTDKHIRHLPVVDNGKIVGVLSIGDIVSRIMKEQHETIQQLENYIIRG
jgi:CBS domain-containing protein